MKGIPKDAWPDNTYGETIVSGNWKITLSWDDNKRLADLKHENNDHTAWFIEKQGKYVNYDIGGS
jgi:hypothetical protein